MVFHLLGIMGAWFIDHLFQVVVVIFGVWLLVALNAIQEAVVTVQAEMLPALGEIDRWLKEINAHLAEIARHTNP